MENCKSENVTSLNGFSVHASLSLPEKKDVTNLHHADDSKRSSLDESPELEIIAVQKKFRNFYKKSLEGIENCDEDTATNNGMLRILLTYVEQLEEQNDLLIETVAELEKEASERVQQMERRLKSTAKTTMETVINFHEWGQEMERLVKERMRIEAEYLKMQDQVGTTLVENNFLRDQNFNLNHDIQALLHIIHHARSTGHWEMDCVTFCEVTPEQVFGPVQPLESYYPPRLASPTPEFLALEDESPKKNNNSTAEKLSNADASSLPSFNTLLRGFRKEMESEGVKEGKCLSKTEAAGYTVRRHSNIPVPKNLPRSYSVSAFGHSNMCSYYRQNMFSYKSCSIIDNKTSATSSDAGDSYTLKTLFSETPDENKQSCNSLTHSSYTSVFHRAYSEPHLFMFGDSIYVYRPCEPLHRVSSFNIKDNSSSLHPCRSIDLKLPSDSQNCERAWGVHHSATDFCISRSSSMACGIDQISKDSSCSSLSHSKDFHDLESCVDSDTSQYKALPPLSLKSKKNCQTDKLCSSPVRRFMKKDLPPKSTVISCGVQTADVKSFSVGLQANFSSQNSDSVTKVLSENGSTVDGMTVADVNKTIQTLKNSLQKAEDQVSAQTILIQELQGHLNTVSKNVEMKDAVLEIVEKKLNESRSEAKAAKDELSNATSKITDLQRELDEARVIHNGLEEKMKQHQEKIEELRSHEKVLQDQKRSLMTQLDAQGDELETKVNELILVHQKLEKCSLQVEQQNQIMMSLQEALVQSKRAYDEVQKAHKSYLVAKHEVQNRPLHSSRNAILDL